jgi:hypothetical protein
MSVAKTRARLGLYTPYGPAAKKIGLGEKNHPHAVHAEPRRASSTEPRQSDQSLRGIALGGFGRSGPAGVFDPAGRRRNPARAADRRRSGAAAGAPAPN